MSEQNKVEATLDLLALTDTFPDSERAPQALYTIGINALKDGLTDQAVSAFERLQREYPEHRWDAVGYWLGRAYHAQGQPDAGDAQWNSLTERAPDVYFGILAAQGIRDISVTDGRALTNMATIAGPPSRLPGDDGSQEFAEEWLQSWIEFDETSAVSLPDDIKKDQNMVAGKHLLRMGLRHEAQVMLERIFQKHKDNPRALYALSMEFEDIGTYSLSLRSMVRLLQFGPAQLVEETPIFMQQRAYPQRFSDLIVDAAHTYSIDPNLYFSLIRQESLFEDGARSSAAAQGLAQIIPDTGQWIADRIGYPGYSNDLIYRPIVNVHFGAYYLDWVRDYLDGNMISALVGYNAGPGNADRWRREFGDDDPFFVERITYSEPRIYVQSILSNYYHYTRLYAED